MIAFSVIVFGVLLYCVQSVEYRFPKGFRFGAATSAYQVEGGWNASDKGESVWDRFLHTRPELVADGSNGDMACDSYHLWKRDIEILQEMGLNMYRFSISWPRLLPSGFPNIISEDGKRYYNDLIDGLLEKGIEPVVTMYHWDLPQSLQDLGGWSNPLVVDWFTDYANVVFSIYGDRVKFWLTLNEPLMICDFGYGATMAPYIDDLPIGRFLCNKNVLIAHAKVYRLYDEIYRPQYNGKVSLTIIFFWFEPATPEDVEWTELATEYWEILESASDPVFLGITLDNRLQWGAHISRLAGKFRSAAYAVKKVGRYEHPIYSKEGGWPKKLEKFLLKKGIKEGYPYPRLPPFTTEETELVKGTYDFYALNHYTTRLIRKLKPGEKQKPFPLQGIDELGVNFESDPSWKGSDIFWLAVYPKGLRRQLNWLNTQYDVKEIIITENGMLTFDAGLADISRLEYIKGHLEQIWLAINDSVPVTGYTTWAMLDNFEWFTGYGVKSGLYAVDFNDPNRTRTARESARFYASVAKSHAVNSKDDLNLIPL